MLCQVDVYLSAFPPELQENLKFDPVSQILSFLSLT